MTSHFDELEDLGYMARKHNIMKKLVFRIAELARKDIESKGIKFDRERFEKLYGEFGIFMWFAWVHNVYDHKEEYHLKLISRDVSDLINIVHTITVMKHMVTKRFADRIFRKYPDIKEMLTEIGMKDDGVCYYIFERGG